MKVLRKQGQFELLQGDGMARGLYRMINNLLTNKDNADGLSLWIDCESKDLLMMVDDAEFVSRAKQLSGNNI